MPTHTIKKVPTKSVSRIKSRISVREIKFSQDVLEEKVDHDSHHWNRRRTSTWQDQNPYLDKEPLVEINRTLKCVNPQINKSLVEFSHTEGCYVPATIKNHNIKLLKLKSVVDHVDTKNDDFSVPQQEEIVVADTVEEEIPEYKEIDKESDEDINDIEDEELKETKDEKELQDGNETKKLMNQFNFCERATVTHSYIHRESSSQTEPPIRAEFSDYVNQWIIYDSYAEDYEMQQKEKHKRDKMNNVVKKEEDKKKITTDLIDSSSNISKASLVIERMINQNMYNDILLDFRYYEDPSDEFRTKQGTLLPLWKFECNDCKKLCVTDIKWNENYFDLFVVSFGSFNMQKQPSDGYFCLWSLKNPSYPEYVNSLETGIMSIDCHKARPYLIAVGTYDGLVAVFDCRLRNKNPIYKSRCNDNKHTGAVWQVVWGNDEPDGGLIFFSVSSDGSVFSWTLMHEDLSYTLVTSLNISHPLIPDQPQMKYDFKGSGTCIAFHPSNPLLFFVGSEEGLIYECSCAYMSTYLNTYKAHHMSVNRIHCNHFIPDVFASCSTDWSVKIWERGTNDPLFMFDMGSAVGDVKWSKHSSTVLAAVTNDCKVFVFDLNIDKYNPIADQTVLSKKSGKLTRIDFNYKLPIIIVGNDRGLTFALKLSPNLRIKPKIPKKHQEVNLEELESAKLEKVLSLVREPTGSVIVPNTSSEDSSSL